MSGDQSLEGSAMLWDASKEMGTSQQRRPQFGHDLLV